MHLLIAPFHFFLFTGILYLIHSGLSVKKSVALKVCLALYHFHNVSKHA